MNSKKVDSMDIDSILHHYLTAALWSSINEESETEEFFDERFSIEDFDECTVNIAKNEIRAFLLLSPKGARKLSPDMIGHDFWLTRNGHGAGFWDRGLGKLGDKLTDASEKLGGVNHVFEDDGKVYIE